jgi:hypothetical protein
MSRHLRRPAPVMGKRGTRGEPVAGRVLHKPRTSKYPLELWADGNEHTVDPSEFGTLTPRGFIDSVRNQLDVKFSRAVEVLAYTDATVTFRTYYRE